MESHPFRGIVTRKRRNEKEREWENLSELEIPIFP